MAFLTSLVVAAALLLSPSATWAQSTAEGALRGYVKDEQGSSIPGVAIVATSPTVGGSREAVSDAEGFYRLTNLPPGEYSLAAEIPGFARFVRPGIVVRAGLNLAVDIALKVGSLQETVQVTAETPMLDVDKPLQAVNIQGELQRTLPLSSRRDYTDFLEVTPGLNTYVNPQSGGGIYSLRGSTIESHVVQVDGADMSSFRQSRPDYIAISSDSLEDVQVKIAASDASAPLGNGVVINVATPSGTNQLHGSISTAYASESWNGDNNPVGDANFSSIRQADFSLGGPIHRDRFWFFGSYRKAKRELGINRSAQQVQFHQILNQGWTAFNNAFEGDSALIKMNGRASDKHLVEGFYQWDDYPTTSNEAVDSANVQVQAYGGIGYSGRLSSVWSNSFSTRISGSYNNKGLNSTISAYDGYLGSGPSRPVHAGIFLSQGRATGTGQIVRLDNIEMGFLSPGEKWTVSADATWYKTGWVGSHELQFGTLLQPRMLGASTTIYSNGGFAMEEVVLRDPNNPAGGIIPFHRRVYDVESIVTADVEASDNAVYVQDSWRPHARLTVNAGLRLDWVQGHDRQADIQTQDSLEVGPRFGATYSLTEDRLNILRASWGRVHELVQSIRVPVLTSADAGRVDLYDNNLDGIFETVLPTPGATTTRRDRVLDPDVHQPHVDEWTVGYRRQFPGQLALDAGFVRRFYKDRPAQVEVNGIYDGGVFSGYRDQTLNDILLITNSEWNWYEYTSLEFLITKRTSNVQLIGSYVRAWRQIDGTWQPNDPASFIQPDAFANDKCIGIPRTAPTNSLIGTADTFGCTGWQDHTGRIAVTWNAPWELIVAGSYTVQSGPFTGPVVTRIAAPDPRFGPATVTLGNGRVVPNPLATTIRFAGSDRGDQQVKAGARNELNLRAGRKFELSGRRLKASVDVFNVLNGGAFERYRTDSNQLYNPNYLVAQNLQPPRVVQASLRFVF
ncbi:MAG: TonB-dependent receptor domain-containing protein [Vicinamibacterales bacterium]